MKSYKSLTKEEAGEYAFALDMVQLAPSAANKQPWRIVRDENCFHFYEKKEISNSAHDIQRLDIGIAGCHFEMAAKEKKLKGSIKKLDEPNIPGSDSLIYVFSWVSE